MMEPERISGFAGDATAWFLKDLNDDERDDAVACYGERVENDQWWTALSNGEILPRRTPWTYAVREQRKATK